jgi:hypothetical protein
LISSFWHQSLLPEHPGHDLWSGSETSDRGMSDGSGWPAQQFLTLSTAAAEEKGLGDLFPCSSSFTARCWKGPRSQVEEQQLSCPPHPHLTSASTAPAVGSCWVLAAVIYARPHAHQAAAPALSPLDQQQSCSPPLSSTPPSSRMQATSLSPSHSPQPAPTSAAYGNSLPLLIQLGRCCNEARPQR